MSTNDPSTDEHLMNSEQAQHAENGAETHTPAGDGYGAESIQVLKDLEAVRKRPGMYIGGTGPDGLMHLIWEVLDNAIDEALGGYCDEITVTIHPDDRVTVSDNGRGIPVDMHEEGLTALELVMTKLHAGGKFDHKSYQVSGGLHGVGVSVVTALSEEVLVEIQRNGTYYRQRFSRGFTAGDLETVGPTDGRGTTITFTPDEEIFEEIQYDVSRVSMRLRELAYLNPGLKINFINEDAGTHKEFQFDGGIAEFVQKLNEGKDVLHDEPVYFSAETDDLVMEVAMQFTHGFDEHVFAFANNINTKEGGTHLTGFKSALTRTFNEYGREKRIITQDEDNLEGRDVREGLTAIISVKLGDPQFEGQTKTKLGNPEVHEKMLSVSREHLMMYLNNNPGVARPILEKAVQAAHARIAAKKARQLVRRKGVLNASSLPGKLADCSEKDPEQCELFIVEGDSAGGSAKQGRSREFQAILPLRGKVLNVEKAPLNKLLDNKELNSVITVLGTGIREEFNIENLRYHKIIILADADVDGAHIRTLLLTFFFRNFRPLIEGGHIYIAKPPLYQIKEGRQLHHLHDEEELTDFRAEHTGKLDMKRFKGLGEMNPNELWNTTLNPENRVLKQVQIEDALEAEELFTILMGSDVGPRRQFIMDNAEMTTNLDI